VAGVILDCLQEARAFGASSWDSTLMACHSCCLEPSCLSSFLFLSFCILEN
jgi:hypothetical protein